MRIENGSKMGFCSDGGTTDVDPTDWQCSISFSTCAPSNHSILKADPAVMMRLIRRNDKYTRLPVISLSWQLLLQLLILGIFPTWGERYGRQGQVSILHFPHRSPFNDRSLLECPLMTTDLAPGFERCFHKQALSGGCPSKKTRVSACLC